MYICVYLHIDDDDTNMSTAITIMNPLPLLTQNKLLPLPRLIAREKQTANLKNENNVKMLPKMSCAATGKCSCALGSIENASRKF